MASGAELTASPVAALAVGFLFAGAAAILGVATRLELGEGFLADRTGALQGGLRSCMIEFGQQKFVLGIHLVRQELTELFQFRKGQVQGDHEFGQCYDLPVTFFEAVQKVFSLPQESVTSFS